MSDGEHALYCTALLFAALLAAWISGWYQGKSGK